ncbi:hypothetical protein Godav_014836, partial [Gossypium davidsonii]|nr:hypothetical protein [Gossypium davidsonii]MBA0649796.1 hypothetical protein [Gossypium klotzschianum]
MDSLSKNSLCQEGGTGNSPMEALIPKKASRTRIDEDEDFDIVDGDIQKSIVNSIPLIEYSNKIHQLLTRDMENTVALKLLGQNIGYFVLHSKIYSIWKPLSLFKLMDIKNGYFLAKFKKKLDCEK